MKYLALFICLIGLLSLFLYLKFSIPVEIYSSRDLIRLEDNQKVIIDSEISGKRVYPDNILFSLKNNLTLNCDKPCVLDTSQTSQKIIANYNEFYKSLDFISLSK